MADAQTAVLGIASTTAPRFVDGISLASFASTSSRPSDPIKSRAIARRKQQRKDNARLASNPHIVRPSPRDYALKHNDHAPSFPIPADLQHIFTAATTASHPARHPNPEQGGLRMSYSDAHWFLTSRVGIRPKQHDSSDMGGVQRFAKTAECEIAAWLEQDVFLRPDFVDRVLFADDADDTSPLVEHARHPHSLVWQVADPFKRLIVHCLARIYGCATLSKDSSGAARQTWILKSRAQQLQQPRRVASIAALDTPPTTDVGTDVASTANTDSDWTGAFLSDVDDDVLSDSGPVGDHFDRDDVDDNDDDVTPHRNTPHRFHSTLPEHYGDDDDEADHFADVES